MTTGEYLRFYEKVDKSAFVLEGIVNNPEEGDIFSLAKASDKPGGCAGLSGVPVHKTSNGILIIKLESGPIKCALYWFSNREPPRFIFAYDKLTNQAIEIADDIASQLEN
jgi:hypothetical protein